MGDWVVRPCSEVGWLLVDDLHGKEAMAAVLVGGDQVTSSESYTGIVLLLSSLACERSKSAAGDALWVVFFLQVNGRMSSEAV